MPELQTEPPARRFHSMLSPRYLILVGVLAILMLACVHQLYLGRAHPDALYMDSLRLLFQMEQWQNGQMSTLEFWGQGSSHRGFVNQLFLLGNVSFFNLDVLLANRLTGGMIALVALILVLAWCRDAARACGRRLGLMEVAVAITIALLCFSWAGVELLTLDLGLPLWTKNLAFILFFVGHARLLGSETPRALPLLVLLSIAGPVIVLMAGMGWNYAFICAVVAAQMLALLKPWSTGGRWLGVVPTAMLLVAMGVYLAAGTITDAAVKGGVLPLDSELPTLPFYAIGSSLGNPEALLQGGRPIWLLAIAGFIVVLCGTVAIVAWLRRGAPGSRLPLYLVLYGALVATSVALARGADGPAAVIASRYYMDVVIGLIGVVWIVAREARARSTTDMSPASVFTWILLSAIISGHLWTYAYEWRVSPYRAASFAAMNRALLRSVPDEDAAMLLQSPLSHARQGADVMREHRLAIFEPLPPDACRSSDMEFGQGWNGPEAHGRWSEADAELVLPACECDFLANISVPESLAARTVEIATASGGRQRFVVEPGTSFQANFGAGTDSRTVHLIVSPTTVPRRDQSGSSDGRTLGVLINGVTVACPTP